MTVKFSFALSVAVSGCSDAFSRSGEFFGQASTSPASGSTSFQGSIPSPSPSPQQIFATPSPTPVKTPTPTSRPTKTPDLYPIFVRSSIDSSFEANTRNVGSSLGGGPDDRVIFNSVVMINGNVYTQLYDFSQSQAQPGWFPTTLGVLGDFLSCTIQLNTKENRYDFAFPGKSKVTQSNDATGSPIVDYMPIDGVAEYRKWVRFRTTHPSDNDNTFSTFDAPDIVTAVDDNRAVMVLQQGVVPGGITEVPIGNLQVGWSPRCSGEGCPPEKESKAEYISRLLAFGSRSLMFCSPSFGLESFNIFYLPYVEISTGKWQYEMFPKLKALSGSAANSYTPVAQACGVNADDGKLYLWFGRNVWGDSNLLRIPEGSIIN